MINSGLLCAIVYVIFLRLPYVHITTIKYKVLYADIRSLLTILRYPCFFLLERRVLIKKDHDQRSVRVLKVNLKKT